MLPSSTVERIRANLETCRAQIAAAAHSTGRSVSDITLVAVTKYVDAEVIRALYDLGLRVFGESRAQRLRGLTKELADLTDVEWHMIGHLQRNKVGRVLEVCSYVHSLDSERLAEEIAAQSQSRDRPPPSLFVEVNVASDTNKTGLSEDELEPLLRQLETDERLRNPSGATTIQGLMTMPPLTEDPEIARPFFRRLRELRDQCVERGLLPTDAGLSMGMSRDFTIAIEEGATVVRIGSTLYEGTGLRV